MITRSILTGALLAGALGLAACGDNSTAPSVDKANQNAADAAKMKKESDRATADAVKMAEEKKKETDKMTADGAKWAEEKKDEAVREAALAKDQAQKLIDDAGAYIKDGKYDLAQTTINALKTLRPKLNVEMQGKIDQLTQTLETVKKSGADIKIPS